VPRVHRGYPAEKPPAVSEVLINQSSIAGELVADPFMGSGSVGVAAVRAGRRFAGTDVNPEAVRLTADRLRQFGEGLAPDGLPMPENGRLELSDAEPGERSEPTTRRASEPSRSEQPEGTDAQRRLRAQEL
jgi:site-specific DNA-methyltransferase (adenine-specific)